MNVQVKTVTCLPRLRQHPGATLVVLTNGDKRVSAMTTDFETYFDVFVGVCPQVLQEGTFTYPEVVGLLA